MKIVRVNGDDKDFFSLCKRLENFQYGLMPILQEKGYELTSDLKEIEGYVLYIGNLPFDNSCGYNFASAFAYGL